MREFGLQENAAHMNPIRFGENGPMLSQVGLGCMAMPDMYWPSDEPESIATIHAAFYAE